MAPELLAVPMKEYNLKADVYTFGIVLWQMFSLQLPFSFARSREELLDYVGKLPFIFNNIRLTSADISCSFFSRSARTPRNR